MVLNLCILAQNTLMLEPINPSWYCKRSLNPLSINSCKLFKESPEKLCQSLFWMNSYASSVQEILMFRNLWTEIYYTICYWAELSWFYLANPVLLLQKHTIILFEFSLKLIIHNIQTIIKEKTMPQLNFNVFNRPLS